MAAEVKPRTLAARLFLQSLRLARARHRRSEFDERVGADLRGDIEARVLAPTRHAFGARDQPGAVGRIDAKDVHLRLVK